MLAESLGVTQLSKSPVSAMVARHLDEQVAASRNRPLDAGPDAFVWFPWTRWRVSADCGCCQVCASGTAHAGWYSGGSWSGTGGPVDLSARCGPRLRTAGRTARDGFLLPGEADCDLGRCADSRHGMQQVVEHGGRLVPAARRGLAHLADDFPTALDTPTRSAEPAAAGRVEGDVCWPQGAMNRAAAAYEAAREEAARHGIAGEQATAQAHRALAVAYADLGLAEAVIALAEQLLTGMDLRATQLTVQVAGLVRDAVTHDLAARAARLEADVVTQIGTITEF